jgi:Ca-activated chloride channel family protein
MSSYAPQPQSPIPPTSNEFKDYGVNPFIDAWRDHLSTFALDTDTASYAMARKYISEGNLPPYQAVRTEEFVNSFNQGYAPPVNGTFAVYADGAPSPIPADGTVLIRIGVQGAQLNNEQRKAGAYVFVVDESGSMASGGRIDIAKNAIKMMVNRLAPSDWIGIVAFSNSARTVLPPTLIIERSSIFRAIDSIQPTNSTNLQAGLQLGYQMASRAFRTGGNNRVILFSDGVANEGGIQPDEILRSVQDYANRDIALTCVGVGFGNYNDVLMETLADKSKGGNYTYINSDADAERQLVRKVMALQTIADDAKIQVDFNPDVVAQYRLLGYENRAVADVDFRNDAVKGGGIGAGHTTTAMYAVRLRPSAQGRIATVNLRWQEPDSKQWREVNGNMMTFDIAPTFFAAPSRYRLAATVALFSEVLRHSPYTYVTLRDISGYANSLTSALREDADVAEFAALANRAAQMQR